MHDLRMTIVVVVLVIQRNARIVDYSLCPLAYVTGLQFNKYLGIQFVVIIPGNANECHLRVCFSLSIEMWVFAKAKVWEDFEQSHAY